jgi:hypothetical protein
MEFKKWLTLQEVGTSTADCAGFSRMVLPMVRRIFFAPWGDEDQDDFFKKKHHKDKDHKEKDKKKKHED